MLGYRYDDSPIVWPDGTPAPLDDPNNYVQTARPGARGPHVWLADGQRRAVRLDRSNPQIAGIGHGVWAALAEGKTLIEVRFDGAGSLAAEPQNRGRSITEAHALANAKPGGKRNPDWLQKLER